MAVAFFTSSARRAFSPSSELFSPRTSASLITCPWSFLNSISEGRSACASSSSKVIVSSLHRYVGRVRQARRSAARRLRLGNRGTLDRSTYCLRRLLHLLQFLHGGIEALDGGHQRTG